MKKQFEMNMMMEEQFAINAKNERFAINMMNKIE